MPDLIAQGTSKAARWRKGLPEIASGRVVLLGREPKVDHGTVRRSEGGSAQPTTSDRHEIPIPWAVPWDGSISRHHATLAVLANNRLEVTRDPRSRNPIFHRGRPQERFVVVPGEHFVIGETTFTLARRPGFTDQPPKAASVRLGGVRLDDSSVVEETQSGGDTPHADHSPGYSSGEDVTEMAFAESFLRNRDFRDSGARIQLLARLPDLVSGSVDEEELLVRVTDVLLRATPAASAVAIVRANAAGTGVASEMQVLHYDTRDSSTAEQDVSARLVATTLKRRESVLHLWENTSNDSPDYTAAENVDWAFCVPLRSEACHGWAIYVAGSRTVTSTAEVQLDDSVPLAERISDDMKFAEVVGSLVSGIRQAAQFQQRHAAMRRFFAPVVLDALAGEDAQSWLQPRQCDLSVMFCDLRGFSRTSEVHSDQLLLLLGASQWGSWGDDTTHP